MVAMAPVKKINKKFKRPPPKIVKNDAEEEEEVPKEIRVMAQEVRLVQGLANNDLNVRTKQMKRLRKWLQLRSKSTFPFKEDDFMRMWKGMYYHFWLSDKPLVQEALAEEMSQLLDCFEGNVEMSVHFFGAFMKTMCQQWFGMDQWRMDKYMMLVRRMLRSMFVVLKQNSWNKEAVEIFNEHMLETILGIDVTALGLSMHYFDIVFEELAKVANGEIDDQQVFHFIKPFIQFLSYETDYKLIEHCKRKVFFHLLYQSSLGREYQEKYNAWKRMGFPTKSINDLEKIEKVEESDDEGARDKGEQPMDPRAGNVDVYIEELPINGQLIVDEFNKVLLNYDLVTKRRKMFQKLLGLFERYQNGEFPLGVKKMPRFESHSEKPLISDKIEQLDSLENELYGTERKLKKLNKRKRRKLLKTLNYDEANEDNLDEIIEKALPKNIERRKEALSAFMNGWVEEELDESELPVKKSKIETKEKKQKDNSEVPSKQKATHNSSPNKQKKLTNGLAKEPTIKEPLQKGSAKKILRASKAQQKAKSKENQESTASTPVKGIKKLPPVLKISTDDDETPAKQPQKVETPISKKAGTKSEWDEPLAEGEIEYFLPSTKLRLKQVNKSLRNEEVATPVRSGKPTFSTPGSSAKRVKIALKHNTSQNPSEYIKQVKSSPNVPYDASRKPSKGLLKPNVTPGPINPFYKKKIGLKFLNDTL